MVGKILHCTTSQKSIPELEALVKEAPWCSTFQMLLAKKYQDSADTRFEKQLNQSAIRLFNREILFDVLTSSELIEKTSEAKKEAIIVSNEESRIQQDLEETKDENVLVMNFLGDILTHGNSIETSTSTPEVKTDIQNIESPDEKSSDVKTSIQTPQLESVSQVNQAKMEVDEDTKIMNDSNEAINPYAPNESQSFADWLHHFVSPSTDTETHDSDIKENSKKNSMKTKELHADLPVESEEDASMDELDFIIKTNTPYDLFAFEKDLTDNQVNQVNNFIDQQIKRKVKNPDALTSTKDKSGANYLPADDLVTETLAKLYLKQGKKDKAILAYKKLLLKFPEKSSFFALQIELITKR